jgi:alpha-N-arabinofuranosidase
MTVTARSAVVDEFRLGEIDRRLFGSFVEHIGRCVYGGIYEPGSPYADANGLRSDVLDLVRELGTTVVRYPGGNFVSAYRWEDGVGPVGERPTRIDPAWRSIETNEFGLHEFMRWSGKAGCEPMMAVNLGTRGIQEACDLLEYCNQPAGTALADRRAANGSRDPFDVKLWCLGNEMDGPWQVGHRTADDYGRLAAEAAKAMRQIDPTIELVACGSSNPRMPTFGEWEATVLDHAYEHVDYISLHAYYQQLGDDVPSFLASGYAMDRFISNVVATADHVAAKKRSAKRLKLSFDEWNIWYETRHTDYRHLDLAHRPRLNEDVYTGLDAVVVGGLLIALLRHADRIGVACLAQLVNVIAPIWAESGQRAWRQTIFHPLALTAAHARGAVLDVRTTAPLSETSQYGPVPAIDAVATVDDEHGTVTVFVTNSHPSEVAEWSVSLRGFTALRVVEHVELGGPAEWGRANTRSAPEAVVPRPVTDTALTDDVLAARLEPGSWSMIRLVSS